MTDRKYRLFWVFSFLGILAVCCYPIQMGVKVILRMSAEGSIPVEEYPKYVIPYSPIAAALIAGVVLMPAFQRKRKGLAPGGVLALAVFFLAERLMETKILVRTEELVPLEGWQMSLCYIPPEQYQTRTWEAVDVLLGGYSPAFKLHFYLISVLIILSILNCIYGFGNAVRRKTKISRKLLTVQALTSASFLGMCIWACFTAFYRGGEITVSALSAVLMTIFFVLMGVNAGVFAASCIPENSVTLSAGILPATVAVLITSAMYAGEMILLNGNLYRFGHGFFFSGICGNGLSPSDIAVIILSGAITWLICRRKCPGSPPPEE